MYIIIPRSGTQCRSKPQAATAQIIKNSDSVFKCLYSIFIYIYLFIYLFKDFKDSFFWFDRFSPFDLHSATLLRMLLHEVGDGHFLTDSSSKPSAQLPCQFTPRSLQTAMATAYLLWRSGTRNFHCGLAQCNAIICSINVYKLKAIVDWSSRSWAKKKCPMNGHQQNQKNGAQFFEERDAKSPNSVPSSSLPKLIQRVVSAE